MSIIGVRAVRLAALIGLILPVVLAACGNNGGSGPAY